jgi:ferritin-like metal-binding protein YciE
MQGQEIIVRYLQDAEAAETNFEDALSSFSKMGGQSSIRPVLSRMSQKARSQQERLKARVEVLGGSTSAVKSALAHFLGFAPILAQVGEPSAEKSTQQLIITIAAAAAEMAMYEALGSAAAAAGDQSTEALARQLQREEREDHQQAEALLHQSALDAFGAMTSDGQRPFDLIRRHLEDAIAAEKSFEDQLRRFAEVASSEQIHHLFLEHADETRRQYERLTERLRQLGGRPSGVKSFLAQLFGLSPKIVQVGHDTVERVTQDLIIAYAVENSEVAMYESLIALTEAAGDQETAAMARDIQRAERETAGKVWRLIEPWAHTSFNKLAGAEQPTT